MEIEGDTIIFSSTEDNYRKEESGRKSNTVRRFMMWSEMKAFAKFIGEAKFTPPNKKIRINRKVNYDHFERWITDITLYEGYYIISWNSGEKK